jgi:hypothetical protein
MKNFAALSCDCTGIGKLRSVTEEGKTMQQNHNYISLVKALDLLNSHLDSIHNCISLIEVVDLGTPAGKCDYSSQRDSRGYRCGFRADSMRPGGRLAGEGIIWSYAPGFSLLFFL